jgi:hypothetical protein
MMFLSFPFAQALAETPTTEILTKLTELFAVHGIYALVVFFLFYQQRRTLADAKAAAEGDRASLMKIYKGTIVATYVLIAIAIPIWVYATFIYRPKTVLWGDVANLTQMAGTPQSPGQVFVDEQVTPEQRGVSFYVNSQPDPYDPSKETVNWALVEDGQYTQVPLVFSHRFKELVPAESGVPLDPSHPSQSNLRDISQRKKFVVPLSELAGAQGYSFDYRYDPDARDPAHTIGALRLLRNGTSEGVPMEDIAQERSPRNVGVPSPILSWFVLPSVLAQGPAGHSMDAATVGRILPLLGSRDLKQQLMSEQTLSSAQTIPWDSIRTALADPKSTADHTLLVHNLANVITSWSAKGVAVPADVRLNVAKASYEVSDFKTATPLFNGLKDTDLGTDFTVYYYRGVSNLKVGNYDTASKDLAKYASKAPNPGTKAIAQRTLSVANQKARAKQ